jgi:transcription antitermination factor NusG
MNKDNAGDQTGMKWFALAVRFGLERVVAEALQSKSFEAFAPLCLRRQSDRRIQETETPLFPGYAFAKFEARFRLPILMTPGVRCVVGYGRTPVPLDSNEIETIRNVVRYRAIVEQCPYLPLGSKVRVVRGPLAGVEGVLIETRSSLRVVLSVSLIRQSVRVEVYRDMLAFDSGFEPTRSCEIAG